MSIKVFLSILFDPILVFRFSTGDKVMAQIATIETRPPAGPCSTRQEDTLVSLLDLTGPAVIQSIQSRIVPLACFRIYSVSPYPASPFMMEAWNLVRKRCSNILLKFLLDEVWKISNKVLERSDGTFVSMTWP
jgi:hypothetical protein